MLFFFFSLEGNTRKCCQGVKEMEDSGWVGGGGKPVLYILHFSELFYFSNNIYSPLLPFQQELFKSSVITDFNVFFIISSGLSNKLKEYFNCQVKTNKIHFSLFAGQATMCFFTPLKCSCSTHRLSTR